MKKIVTLLLAFLLAFLSFPFAFAENTGKITYYVAVDGNDHGKGTTEEPLATLEGARQKVRETLAKYPDGINIDVIFKSGEYRFSQKSVFDKNDSAVSGFKVTYKGEDNVYFKGSVPVDITKISLVTDSKILKRLPTVSKGKVGQIDLKAQGINVESYSPNVSDSTPEDYSFFLNGKEQTCAEWPNGDGNYAQYQTVLKAGGAGKYNEGAGGGTFKYEDTRADRWTTAKDFYIMGWLSNDYVQNRSMVKSVDPENQAIELKYGTEGGIGTSFSRRWKAVNLLEELDVPGEWYLDRETSILYYYPEKSLYNAKFEMSVFKDYMISMTGTSNIAFENINFTQSCSGVLTAGNYPDNISVENCTFTYLGRTAISVTGSVSGIVNKSLDNWRSRIDGGTNWHINNCTFAHLKQSGVSLTGGNRDTLTSSGNIVENCYFTQIPSKFQGYYYCVQLSAGCGDIVRNNVMNNTSFHCIDYSGNDYKILNNELYNVTKETADTAVIYTGRYFTERGTEIAYNYIHDNYPVDSRISPSNNGVYLDDAAQGSIVHHNIFKKIHRGVCANGATDHQVYSNIFVDSAFATHINTNFITYPEYIARNATMYSDVENIDVWQKSYPNMKDIVNKYPGKASFNIVKDNVAYNANYTIYDEVKQYGTVENNVTLENTDSFVDYANNDFRLKESGDVLDSSFNMSEIGIKADEETGEVETPKLMHTDFQQIYPKNGEANIAFQNVYFKWENATGADKYRLVIAKNKELTDVVADTVCDYNYYTVDELDPAVDKYYWKVTAINESLQFAKEWESDNAVFVFNLSPDYELDKTSLEKSINFAKNLLETVVEGEDVGTYKLGTKVTLQSLIGDGEKLMDYDKDKTTQKEINDCVKAINDFVNSDDITNSGFYDLGKTFSDDGSWGAGVLTQSDDGKTVIKLDGTEKSISTGFGGVNAGSRNMILCFKMRGSFANDKRNWIGIGLRGDMTKDIASSGNDNYFFVIKEKMVEFQRNLRGPAIVKEFENTALNFGEWHDIQFGVINLGTAQMIILNVDGKEVLNYLDTSNSQITQKGDFLFNVTNNHIMEIAGSDFVPSKEEYDNIVKNGYEKLQKEYFETIKTVSDNSVMMKVNCKNYVTEDGVKEFSGGIPIIYNDKTLVPLRTISEFFGAQVDWDENTRSAVIKSNGKTIEFFENKNSYTVDGIVSELTQAPIIKDDTLLVPLREATEALNKDVYWYDTGLIIIGTNQKIDTQNKYSLLNNISQTFENMNKLD